MPGMGTGLGTHNPVIVSAFHTALLHEGLVVLGIAFVVALCWNLLRSAQLRRAGPAADQPALLATPEPVSRRLLRLSFGLLWIFDGVLQGQSSMPLGMVGQVINPAAASSPTWIQHLDNATASIWSFHPIAAPAAAVWIQIGIGVWLLAAPPGYWSRLGGLASVAWGLIVWIAGEAFGQIFAPGLSWLTGAPGAVLLYCVAGGLIALPERTWATPRLGQFVVRGVGLFFVGMALLQAWPGRGFWQGQASPFDTPGTLTKMIRQMAQTSQPHFLSSWVAAFGAFDAAHGWAVNFFAVVALAAIGVAFLSTVPRVVRVGVLAALVLCLADWVLVEDLGFMGGVGTDPNSMIPLALVFVAGYLAMTRVPVRNEIPAALPAPSAADRSWRERMMARPTYAFRAIAALGAIGITLIGVVPMTQAATNPNADPILARALSGPPTPADTPAPNFHLIDQQGQPVSLASLRGKTLAVTFLDDVCTTGCSLVANEFRVADRMLGGNARRVELIAINADPRFISPEHLRAFDRQEGLTDLGNWRYLTGSLAQLERVWQGFGEDIQYVPGGSTVPHAEFADVIDASGHIRYLLNANPGSSTKASRSSFSVTLAETLENVVASP